MAPTPSNRLQLAAFWSHTGLVWCFHLVHSSMLCYGMPIWEARASGIPVTAKYNPRLVCAHLSSCSCMVLLLLWLHQVYERSGLDAEREAITVCFNMLQQGVATAADMDDIDVKFRHVVEMAVSCCGSFKTEEVPIASGCTDVCLDTRILAMQLSHPTSGQRHQSTHLGMTEGQIARNIHIVCTKV